MLVIPEAEDDKPVLTGLIDWGYSGFAPMFVACRPPQWIWQWKENKGKDGDDQTANDIPASEECRILKRDFEEAAGPMCLRYAHASEYMMARKRFDFALEASAADIWSENS